MVKYDVQYLQLVQLYKEGVVYLDVETTAEPSRGLMM